MHRRHGTAYSGDSGGVTVNKISKFKNFYMNIEIDIAGTFIYRGVREFNCLDHFYNAAEIFHVLYSVSVGIERLQKVLLVLLEEIDPENALEFEKSLITHSHRELHDRIAEKINLTLNPHENRFLDMLAYFYNTCRYNRFCFTGDLQPERTALVNFLEQSLQITIDNDSFFVTPNDDRMKRFWGRVVGSTSRAYYKEIANAAYRLNLFSYELRSDSMAFKVFTPRFPDESLHRLHQNEQIALKEFLIYLMNTNHTSRLLTLMREIPPLDLDVALVQDYLSRILKHDVPQSLIDEIDTLYEDMEEVGSRIQMLSIIGDESIISLEDEHENDAHNDDGYDDDCG